jgi:hypothetical protein
MVKRNKRSVFSPICDVCGAELNVVLSNKQAGVVLKEHKRQVHYGLNL